MVSQPRSRTALLNLHCGCRMLSSGASSAVEGDNVNDAQMCARSALPANIASIFPCADVLAARPGVRRSDSGAPRGPKGGTRVGQLESWERRPEEALVWQVQEYKDSLKTKAEELILKGFPKKIVELNDLLETAQFGRTDLSEVHQQLNIPVPEPIAVNSHVDAPASKKWKYDNSMEEVGGTKVMALPNGPVPCNKHLCDLVFVVKPHIRQLVEDANLLKMWISFMIPKIEDGNNFGVSIQEDTLAEIQSVESEAAAFFDQISRYFLSRGKIVSKVAKYPHIEDYRRAVQELDEKEYLSLWLVMCEVRNRYCTLHDIVIKNLEKLKKPRTSNADSLY